MTYGMILEMCRWLTATLSASTVFKGSSLPLVFKNQVVSSKYCMIHHSNFLVAVL
jgi:hypothetical protein